MRHAQRMFLTVTAASLAALFAASTIAQAKPRHHHAPRGLLVKKRPFTDSGNVVNVGSESRYVYDGQYLTNSPTYGHAPSSYGGETLRGRFDLPGNRPLFNF